MTFPAGVVFALRETAKNAFMDVDLWLLSILFVAILRNSTQHENFGQHACLDTPGVEWTSAHHVGD